MLSECSKAFHGSYWQQRARGTKTQVTPPHVLMRTEPSVLTQLRGYRQALCPDSRCAEKQLVTATLRRSNLPKEVCLCRQKAAWQQSGGGAVPNAKHSPGTRRQGKYGPLYSPPGRHCQPQCYNHCPSALALSKRGESRSECHVSGMSAAAGPRRHTGGGRQAGCRRHQEKEGLLQHN